ncbi:MAG: NAD(P)/FAD-dependent oxidoreductase [Acidobacteriaceae bacterium]|nr:NAD(P)/FAD-dependent oxidoreductase [Acidobacteriaceae bacterium]
MSYPSKIVIVGAGPYGLSIAAHLRAAGVNFQIFGKPMYTWREQMPKGMLLKSDGFASDLSTPESVYTLRHYCAEKGIEYDDTRVPVRLDTFVSYGMAFQKRMVPELDTRLVSRIEEADCGFKVTLEDGETVYASHVVLAVGISHFPYVPAVFRGLGPKFVTHSSQHSEPVLLRGRTVGVVGAGASALDLAGLLKDAGADVSVMARRTAVRFHNPPSPNRPSLWKRLRSPRTGIGPGWKSRFFTDFPALFHKLPEDLRVRIVKHYLGPSAGWTVKEKILGRVPVHTGLTPVRVAVRDERIDLVFTDESGKTVKHTVDQVIAATGYRVDIHRLEFLDPALLEKIQTIENAPVLSVNFESSVPGLFFVGVSSAFSFGPVMRFAYGARYTAIRLTRRLAKLSARQPVPELSEAVMR